MTDYIREKLNPAVRLLATGADSLQQRLERAFGLLQKLRTSDFADFDDQLIFDQIKADLTSVEAQGDEGSVKATLGRMGDGDASRIAERIVDLAEKHQNAPRV